MPQAPPTEFFTVRWFVAGRWHDTLPLAELVAIRPNLDFPEVGQGCLFGRRIGTCGPVHGRGDAAMILDAAGLHV